MTSSTKRQEKCRQDREGGTSEENWFPATHTCRQAGTFTMVATRLQLAELLLEHYPDEKPEALEHLDFAINEFREMKMQPSLERALEHREILGA